MSTKANILEINMFMKKVFSAGCIFLLSLFILIACSPESVRHTASKELGIDVSAGKEISNYDTHSGNGDGTSCLTFSFEDNTVVTEIKSNPFWRSFPLDQTVRTLVYGISHKTHSDGPYLNDNNGNALVPEIQNGYYLLIDRQVKNNTESKVDILQRFSFNLTIGLFDTDTNTLYFCKLDT